MINGNHMDVSDWLGIATMLIVTIAIVSCLVQALTAQRPAAHDTTARG